MNDLRKAAEMALEALEKLRFANAPFLDEAMEALRQALAQPQTRVGEMEWHWGYERGWDAAMKLTHPEQEPVAWMHELADGHRYCVTKNESGYVDNFTDTYKTIPLYTAPPHHANDVKKREWVGLTDEEFEEAVEGLEDLRDCWTQIEAKLKEKNT